MKLRTYFYILCALIFFSCDREEATDSFMKIHSVVPETADYGDEVLIYGANFSDEVNLTIGGSPCDIIYINEGCLKFKVENNYDSSVLELVKGSEVVKYENFYINSNLIISSVSNDIITKGDEFQIIGEGFDSYNVFKNLVYISKDNVDYSPFELLEATSDTLFLRVLEEFPKDSFLKVEVNGKTALSSFPIIYSKEIKLNGFSPKRGGTGDLITLNGANFDENVLKELVVKCGNIQFENPQLIDESTITVKVPKNLNCNSVISLETENFGKSQSEESFRYSYAKDFVLGRFGVLYDQCYTITKETVDSLNYMGVEYIVFNDVNYDFSTGILNDDNKTFLKNIINLRTYSSDIHVVLTLDSKSIVYANIDEGKVQGLLNAIKEYEYNGKKVWECIDAFQILHANTSLPKGSTLNDYVNKLLAPSWKFLHPTDCFVSGEKALISPNAEARRGNVLLNNNQMRDSKFYDYIDIYSSGWNLSTVDTNKAFYSRTVPEDAFYTPWNNFSVKGIVEIIQRDYYMPYICEMGFNSDSAPYINVNENEKALKYMINYLFDNVPYFKGCFYPKFHADDYGIRSLDNETDNRSSNNTVSPQKTHYQMYSDIVASFN